MHHRSEQAESFYDALFDWQAPLSLWEKAENLKKLLGDTLLAARDVGRMDVKRILEGWVIGKTLAMVYHGSESPCLVRVSDVPAMDGQIYHERRLRGIEVTQALCPGRRRNVFGTALGGLPPPAPLQRHEEEAYRLYRDQFFAVAMRQVEERIDHKFRLYQSLDYLLVYVDLFDTQHPRFSYFALSEFDEECGAELHYRLQRRFAGQWSEKIGHLFLLDDKKERFVKRFATVAATAKAGDLLSV